jgi:uncharacterized protein (TIGR03437 family)
MKRTRRIYWAKCAAICSVAPILIYAYAEGPDPGYAGVPGEMGDCTACHVGTVNSGKGGVSVSFPNGLQYTPGVTQHLTVTVQDPDQQRWGFELTARLASDSSSQAGSFTPGADGFTQTKCSSSSALPMAVSCSQSAPLQYIEHTFAGTRLGTPNSASFTFDWTPPASNGGNIAIYVAGNAANGDQNFTGDQIYTKSYTLTPSATGGGNKPTITSVQNGAGYQTTIAAGAWFIIQGNNLASTTKTWSNAVVDGKLPTELPGSTTTVTVNGKPAYLYYISPKQINAVAPADSSTGSVQAVVTQNGVASDAATTLLQPFSPAFFTWPGNYAVATYPNFTYAVKSGEFPGKNTIPVKPGDTIILWGTGFGPTSPPEPDGQYVPFDNRIYNIIIKPQIVVGGMTATYLGGALTPGNAGLYQLAIKVPDLSDGDWPIAAEIGGVSSPAGVLLTVKR